MRADVELFCGEVALWSAAGSGSEAAVTDWPTVRTARSDDCAAPFAAAAGDLHLG